jgi:hypothetical protein
MDKNGFLIELSESGNTQLNKVDFDKQSVPQKVFSAVWMLEAEVNNGGFSQYFFNSSRETVHFVVTALEAIQAQLTADICRRAITTAFPTGLPSDLDAMRISASEFPSEVEEQLNKLDQEFYRYPNNLTDLLFAYVEQHPEEFGPVTS